MVPTGPTTIDTELTARVERCGLMEHSALALSVEPWTMRQIHIGLFLLLGTSGPAQVSGQKQSGITFHAGTALLPAAEILRSYGDNHTTQGFTYPTVTLGVGYLLQFENDHRIMATLDLVGVPFAFNYDPGTMTDSSNSASISPGPSRLAASSTTSRICLGFNWEERLLSGADQSFSVSVGFGFDRILDGDSVEINQIIEHGSDPIDIFQLMVKYDRSIRYSAYFGIEYDHRIGARSDLVINMGYRLTNGELYRADYVVAPGQTMPSGGTATQAPSYLQITIGYLHWFKSR